MRKRVLMVMTREIPRAASNGRERTLCFIRKAIGMDADVRELKIHSVFETGTLASKLRAGLRVAEGLVTGRPCALQVAMFASADGKKRLVEAIEDYQPDVIYFDGIRMVDYAAFVRRRYPSSHIISDLDDLMSRRAHILRTGNFALSVGYLAKSIPPAIVSLINSRFARNLLLRYEESALKGHERRATTVSNAVTLVSTTDADALTRILPGALKRRVYVIAPPVDSVKPAVRPADPVRFVFVGADSQLQNRLAIEYLLASWKKLELSLPLVIYGRMSRQYEAVPNVVFAGFARTLDEVYTPNSIALCPTFLRGGIKSKVLEAVSFGCVPVGNDAAYEGLNFEDAALAMDEARLHRFLGDPSGDLDEVMEAATRFAAFCERNFSMPVFARRWGDLLRPVYVPETETSGVVGEGKMSTIAQRSSPAKLP
ncbi:glycosyltransferase [Burkholderia sp. Ax-1724]|uniref:glycosyltransferase n=1 Tax=Burkholderia sp. Ax-1724 TaxID=2608336 RepID=UPI00141FCD27|nr:glycosyltransferase [Burkholderia sp. Ax-1724]NIF50735.1 glycosyltransferase family 4 protein [Burkholderia sp. Ax-1724]